MKSDEDVISEFLTYISSVKGYSDNTLLAYGNDLRDFVAFIDENEYNKKLLKINAHIAEAYHDYLCGEETVDGKKMVFEASTVNRKLSCLSSFYEYLLKDEQVKNNYFDGLDKPKMKHKHPSVLKNSEIQHMLECCDLENKLGMRNYCLLSVLYGCGLRVSELCSLKILDIEYAEAVMHVHGGKGDKDRRVVMPSWLPDVLRDYLSGARVQLAYNNKGEDERYVFLNKNGTQLTRVGVRKILEGMVNQAGETYHISPHMIRHSFATECLNGGMNIREVQELLGHESLSTTQIYTEVSYVQKKEALDKAFPRAKKPKK